MLWIQPQKLHSAAYIIISKYKFNVYNRLHIGYSCHDYQYNDTLCSDNKHDTQQYYAQSVAIKQSTLLAQLISWEENEVLWIQPQKLNIVLSK